MSDAGTCATGGNSNGDERTVLTVEPIPPKGTYWFSVKILYWGLGLRIGISTSEINLNQMIGNNFYSWALSDCGKIRHGKVWNDYHVELKKGDLITVIINRSWGIVSYEINGNENGVAFTDNKLKKLELYPAVSLNWDTKVCLVKH